MNRSKWLILLMLAAGIAAGTLKVWRQHRHMREVLANLTPPVARRIAEAPKAEVMRLEPVSEAESARDGETLEIEGTTYRVADRKSVIGAKGFADVRVRLVDDASYRWNESFESRPGTWQYLLQFTDGDGRARLAFEVSDQKRAILMLLDDGPTLSADPIADGLATFFAAQFKAPPAPAEP